MAIKDDFKYLAGLFDGEGTVGVSCFVRRDGRRQLITNLCMANTDPTVLYWLENEIGGSVKRQEPKSSRNQRQAFYVWTISGPDATRFAKSILPYSRMKSFQLSKFVELRFRVGQVGGLVSANEWLIRQQLVEEIRSDPYRRKVG